MDKKCKVCGEPSVIDRTLSFYIDIGRDYMSAHGYLCEEHAENLDTSDIDRIYLKSLIFYQSKTRWGKATSDLNNPSNVNRKRNKKPKG
jgi:hypothetical protein